MNERIKKFSKADAPAFESYQDIIARDSTPVADLLALKSNPPQPTDDIPLDQFTSQAFFDLEMERMWPRVWQFVCREEHIPEPGDYYVYEVGRHSALIVRQEDGSVAGFINSCMHRGTKFALGGMSGCVTALRCPFHGWTWSLAGELRVLISTQEAHQPTHAVSRPPVHVTAALPSAGAR